MGDFDISNLTIVEEEFLQEHNLIVRASIIGASHAISFINATTKEIIFTEIIANVNIAEDFPMAEGEIDFLDILSSKKDTYSFEKENVSYGIDFKELDVVHNADVYDAFDTIGMEKIRLEFNFAAKEEKQVLDAKTMVLVSMVSKDDVSDFLIETIHVYPNELKALKTTTTAQVKNIITRDEVADDVMVSAKDLIDRINKRGLGDNESEIIDIVYEMVFGKTFDNSIFVKKDGNK